MMKWYYSFKYLTCLFIIHFILIWINPAHGATTPPQKANTEPSNHQILTKMSALQVPFVANAGQVDEEVSFYARTFGGTLYVTKKGEMVYSLPLIEASQSNLPGQELPKQQEQKGWVLKERLLGSLNPDIKSIEKANTKVNYFIDNDRSKWKSNVSSYNEVSLGEIYKGISLNLRAYGNNVEKIFTVNPGSRPEAIRLAVEGALSLATNNKGELEVETGFGTVKFRAPIAYQEKESERAYVKVAYRINKDAYGFSVGDYDRQIPLIIDPILASTFIGGSGTDEGKSIALDSTGNVYVLGRTQSNDFPAITGPYDPDYNGSIDLFISKLNSDLSALLVSTYIGGSLEDWGAEIALDSADNVYVAGTTQSNNYPTTDGTGGTSLAYNQTFNGGLWDTMISKLNSDLSSLLASTFIGGSNDDSAFALVLDILNSKVYVAGKNYQGGYPVTVGACYDANNSLSNDIVVSRLDFNLTTLEASTYIGEDLQDIGIAIALDSSTPNPNVVVFGYSESNNYPIIVPAVSEINNGGWDLVISKLDANLVTLQASTYIGGPANDLAMAGGSLALDSSNNVYVTGYTSSAEYPTTEGAYDDTLDGPEDAVVSILNPALSSLLGSTFIGGTGSERGKTPAIDSSGNVYVSGYTGSTDFPTTPGAYDRTHNGINDVFISRLNSNLTTLQASTFIGGSMGDDVLYGDLLLDSSGNVYVTGVTQSIDFPTTSGAYDTTHNGSHDAFVSKLTGDLSLSPGTYYVDINRVSEGDGSALTPWKTLHYALQEINSGPSGTYTLNVAAGTYNVENGEADATLVINQDNVTIQGAGAGSTIIDGSGASTWQIGIEVNASNVTISGCEVSNFTMNGINIYSGNFQIVEDCDIHDNDWGIYTNNTSPEIRKNKIYDNTRGIYITVFDGAAYAPIVKNNLIYTTTGTMEYGIEVYAASTGSIASPSIYHNTIDGGTLDGIYIREEDTPSPHDIKFNIITNFTRYGIHNDTVIPGNPVIDYNDVWNNTGGNYYGCTAGTYDISLDPIYVGGGDYNLQSGSPCIDAIPTGEPPSDPVSDDIVGNTRPQGSGYDMGCYESSVADAWHTFMGSVSSDDGYAIAVDGSGNIYVAGYSYATWGSPINPHTGSAGFCDTFVAKLNSSGVLQWNTFMGSASNDFGYSIAVNGSGDVYVAGTSYATWGTPVNAYAGGGEAFVAKLNSSGALQWNTFMGSANIDESYGIAVDNSGNIYVAGESHATWGSPVNAFAGSYDAFAAKLNSSGALQWNTFMGSAALGDIAHGVAVDSSENVYVTGESSATWGSPVNAFAGSYDAFAAKLNSSGALQWNTFMGSAIPDLGGGVAVDGSGNVCLTGWSDATWGLPVNAFAGGQDVFVAQLDSSGVRQWHTFMGSSDFDDSRAIAVDASENIYVAGTSYSTWGSPDNPHSGNYDAFAVKLNSGGALQWHTFMGSANIDESYGIAVDNSGNVYVAGESHATWGSPVNAFAGGIDAFAAKFELGGVSPPNYNLTVTIVGQGSVTLDPTGGTYDAGTEVQLTAIPDSGCNFSAWSGDLTGSTNPETITMNTNKTVTATFNCPPDTPTVSSPTDEATEASGDVTLQASSYSDADNDPHAQTHWRVRRADEITYFHDEISTTDFTVHTVTGLWEGMKYFWQVGYEDSEENVSWSTESAFKVGTLEQDGDNISPGTQAEDFKMISFTQWPDNHSCASVIGVDYNANNYRIGTYNPVTGDYIEYGGSLFIDPGRAYWILARNGLDFTYSGVPVSIDLDLGVSLDYNADTQNGWNQIGCPNDKNYYWGNVQVLDGPTVVGTLDSLAADENYQYIDIRIWKWENGAYVSYNPGDNFLMEHCEGYWVKANRANISLMFRIIVQEASLSTPNTMLASILNKGKRWIKKWVFSPQAAVADSGDSPPLPMGDFSTVSPKSVGGCFIATAVYGSPMERHVRILRDFRDTYLLSSTIGHMFVKAYYRYSPPVADFIAKHKALKGAVRMGLLPMVAFSYAALHFGLVVSACGLLLIFMPLIFLVLVYKRRM